MEKKVIHTENGDLYYWVGGNQNIYAKCIVFVHGMTADHSMFDKQVDISATNLKLSL